MQRSEVARRPDLGLDLSPVVRMEPWALAVALSIAGTTIFPAMWMPLVVAAVILSVVSALRPDFVPETWRASLVMMPVFVGGGVAVALLHLTAPDPLEELAKMEPGEVEIVGTLMSPPVSSGYGSRTDLAVDSLSFDGREVLEGGTVEVYAAGIQGVGVGDGLRVVGEISIPEPDADFDYARYLSTRRVSAVLEASGAWPAGGGRGWIGEVHRRTDTALGYGLRPDEAAVVRGMTLGDRSLIPEELDDAFRDSGITHVLAISGQHVAVLTAALYFLLRFLSTPLAIRVGVSVSVVWVYIIVAGAPPSAVRAGVVATLVLGAALLSRQVSALHFMSTMLALVLAYNPLLIYNTGFQLSVAAVFGIILLRKPLKSLMESAIRHHPEGPAKVVLDLLSVSLAAQVVTTPIIASSFEQVSIVGVFTNLVAVPLSGPILGLGLVSAVLGNVSPVLALPVNFVNGFLVYVLEIVARFAASMPFATVTTPGTGLLMTLAFYLGCVPAGVSRWVIPESRWPFWAGVMLVWTGLWITLSHVADL